MGTTNATWCCFILAVSCCILLASTVETLESGVGEVGDGDEYGNGTEDGDGKKTANHFRRLFSIICSIRANGTTWLLSQMMTLGHSLSTFCDAEMDMACEEIFSCFT